MQGGEKERIILVRDEEHRQFNFIMSSTQKTTYLRIWKMARECASGIGPSIIHHEDCNVEIIQLWVVVLAHEDIVSIKIIVHKAMLVNGC